MLTEAEKIKYTALLTEAETAYHSLMLGGMAVSFQDQNGESIRYSSANRASLLNYINWLRGLLDLGPYGMMQPGRPAGVLF